RDLPAAGILAVANPVGDQGAVPWKLRAAANEVVAFLAHPGRVVSPPRRFHIEFCTNTREAGAGDGCAGRADTARSRWVPPARGSSSRCWAARVQRTRRRRNRPPQLPVSRSDAA